jgi:hypothetical protein
MPKENRGAGRPVREATNIGANEDAPSDGKEIDPEGRKGRRGPSVEFGEDSWDRAEDAVES